MSHQVLARKWRPGTFAEMVGQQHVLQALINALETGRLHHAYLFTGTRGVGKTTVARILAKCLNCDVGVSATPCGECGACVEIAEGRSVDLIEVDAASKTKVEDTRELLENVQYTPTRSRYKIYLIDEVHMLSNHSFNALLKTLEEPPPHALFLLATTDPQKLPATVLSRCLQFNLKNMQPEQIVDYLAHVLAEEKIEHDAEALALIARSAEGSMRDALSLADQAIAFGNGALAAAEVRDMLGTVDRGRVLDLISAILDDDPAAVLQVVSAIAEHAPDYISTLDELGSVLHQMTIAQTVPDAFDPSWPDQARIVELAARATIDDTQLFWQMTIAGRRDVHLASSARAGLEMVLLRMIAFRPAVVIQPDGAEVAAPAKKPEPPVAPVVSELNQSSTTRAAQSAPAVRTTEASSNRKRAPSSENAAAVRSRATLERAHTPSAATPVPIPSANLVAQAEQSTLTPENWPEQFEDIPISGILQNVALNMALEAVSGARHAFVIADTEATLLNDRHAAQLSVVLSEHFQSTVEVTIRVSAHEGRTPGARRATMAAARLAEAERAIAADDQLNEFIRAFDGEIIPGSIRPNADDGRAL